MVIPKEVRELPHSPGVYLMKGRSGAILYVGKAGDLKRRVGSYFSSRHSGRLGALVKQVKTVSYIPTGTEAEALIYEASLIRSLQPRYNVALKDDKSYPYLKVTVNEPFPRLLIVRRVKKDGARYFGPYTDVRLLRQALSFMRKIFPLRTCSVLPKKVCLNYHLGQCLGPCEGKMRRNRYRQVVGDLVLFLEGKREELIRHLTARMSEAASRRDYERAQGYRDTLAALSVVPVRRTRQGANGHEELQGLLGLTRVPRVIEAFDVSNIGPHDAVGAMVRFIEGMPDKTGYRRFKIEGLTGVDDYQMIRQIVERRYRRLAEEGGTRPDVILIDGGKGHLRAAQEALLRSAVPDIGIIALAKEKEELYLPRMARPILLPERSGLFRLLVRIRDEVHRFAITYHRRLRSRKLTLSGLETIRGIGAEKRRVLIRRFGSPRRVWEAPVEEIMKVPGIGKELATKIKEAGRKIKRCERPDAETG